MAAGHPPRGARRARPLVPTDREGPAGTPMPALRAYRCLAYGCALAAVAMAALVLIGWSVGVRWMQSFGPAPATRMRPWAAVGILLCGAVLWLQARGAGQRWRRLACDLGAGAAAAIGLVTVIECVGAVPVGLDTALFSASVRADGGPAPGRMAPATAASLLVIGLTLLALRHRRVPASQVGALVVLLVALVVGFSYLYGAADFVRISSFTNMALHTCVAMGLLAGGVGAATAGQGFLWLLTAGPPAGTLVRRLLPTSIVLVVTLAAALRAGEGRGWYGPAATVALLVVTSGVALAVVTGAIADRLAQATAEEEVALSALADLNRVLESRVTERTRDAMGSSRRFHTAVDSMRDGFAVFSGVRDGGGVLFDFRWDYVNEAGAATYGLRPADLIGRLLCQTTPKLREAGVVEHYRRVVETGQTYERESFGYDDTEAGGTVSGVFDIRAAKLDDGLVIVWRDISERKRQEHALVEALARFRSVFDAAPIGVALVSLDGDASGRLLQVNEQLCRLLGYPATDLVGRSLGQLVHPDDRDAGPALTGLADGTLERYSQEKRYLRADGSPVWVQVDASAVHDEAGRPLYSITHVEDISAAREAQEQLTYRAQHDELTGLANRHLLMARLRDALGALDRAQGTCVAVFYFDLDGFKGVNDTAGHDGGDRLLSEVGRRIDRVVRRPDTAARIGGDEFVVVAAGIIDRSDIAAIAHRIERALAPRVEIEGHSFQVAASIGVAVCDDPAADAADLIHAADLAMYRAKQRGGGYEMFTDALRTAARRRLRTEQDLRTALDRDWLRLHYQPVVRLADRRVVGVEALLRLQHPQRGLLTPADFLDVAESCGLILPIGEWVVAAACGQQATWQVAGSERTYMAVNISGRQMMQDALEDHIAAVIDATGIDPTCLVLELTETVFTEASQSSLSTLQALRARGVRFALDDFGTGYSSLAYLQRFPADIIKIGASFVAGLGTNPRDTTLVSAIVKLGQNLGLTVVAEGVETARQAGELAELGCELAQGFYFARPMPADDVGELTPVLRPVMPLPRRPG